MTQGLRAFFSYFGSKWTVAVSYIVHGNWNTVDEVHA